MSDLIEKLKVLLCEVIADRIAQTDQLTALLKDINYLEHKEQRIHNITNCELLGCDDLFVTNHRYEEDQLLLSYEMSFVMSTWYNQEQSLRITATAMGDGTIAKTQLSLLETLALEEMSKTALLHYKDFITFTRFIYSYCECDDTTA